MIGLLPPAGKTARKIHCHHRSDVWLRVWPGIVVKGREVASAKNPERRARCQFDLNRFLIEYLGHRYYDPSPAHLEIVRDFQNAILTGAAVPTMQAEAEPRSFGKTTISEGAMLWAGLYSHRRFIVCIGAKGAKGEERIAAMEGELLHNSLFREDFPELIEPIHAFSGDPRRAPPGFPWSGNEFRLPNGVWYEGRSIDSAIRGLNKDGARPDMVVLDDIETLGSVRSQAESEMIELRIRQEVLGLHDINKPCAYFFICTIISRGCLSDRLTNPEAEPEWRGRRYSALIKFPERADLWDTFKDLCKRSTYAREADGVKFCVICGQQIETDCGKCYADASAAAAALGFDAASFAQLTLSHQRALRFYVANKAEMDRGAELLDAKRLPLWRIYFEWATKGDLYFYCELQNSPPSEKNEKTLELEFDYLMTRRTGEERGVVPAAARFLTVSIDVGAYLLHWEVNAWDESLTTSWLIDEGAEDTNLNAGGKYRNADNAQVKQALAEHAIRDALGRLRLRFAKGYHKRNGDLMTPGIIGVDCGGATGGGTAESWAWYHVILSFCANAPLWVPLKGERWVKSIADRALGRNWICEQNNNLGRRHDCNSVEYKMRVHRGYQAPMHDQAGNIFPGTRILHREVQQAYIRHQTAEYWSIVSAEEDAPSGKETTVGWYKRPNVDNHWFDTAWMAYALADILSVKRRQQAPPRRVLPRPQGGSAHDPSLG